MTLGKAQRIVHMEKGVPLVVKIALMYMGVATWQYQSCRTWAGCGLTAHDMALMMICPKGVCVCDCGSAEDMTGLKTNLATTTMAAYGLFQFQLY